MNVTQLDDFIYRGPRPDNANDFDYLRQFGIQVMLNLESGFVDAIKNVRNYEASSALTRGMIPVHIALSPFWFPRTDAFTAALLTLHQARATGVKTYVHCKDGVDRTGLVCAAYRIKCNGWSFQQALVEMLAMGFHKFRYFWWIWFFRRYEQEEGSNE